MTESEWCRLVDEKHEIMAAARKAGDATPEQKQRHREIQRRLAEIVAIPPDGYALPKIVADLMEFARERGWKTLVQWTAPGYDDDPFVTVEVGRKLTEQEAKVYRSDTFHFRLTWHSRDCEPGKVKKFGSGTAQTPDHPQWRDGPSVRKIREIIHAHPAPDAVTVHRGPISRADFHKIPNARVLRFSHDWMNLRYAEWIEDAPYFGWSVMADYGDPANHCVVTSPHTRDAAADALTAFLAPGRAYGGDNLTVDEWEIAP
ncbi:hypothetical protein [Streptomyces sp. NBC_00687]|uniref:hypothetical protein n=1 Tax=Streptomyces sp. NBC_00687 TaxID=2975807 RepID=UPI00224E2C58|nr:hypothetical protein [Streptomyces sp. NBC_00687]MCX4912885.1 hypothetical protein [Streptomyces sp. NBC_00687]